MQTQADTPEQLLALFIATIDMELDRREKDRRSRAAECLKSTGERRDEGVRRKVLDL